MKHLFFAILLATLSACGQQTVALPTEPPIPTIVSPTSVPTSTLIPVTIAPTITPTRPGETLITPDGIQVERWKEYQTALAKNVHAHHPPEEVLCEWEILGRSGNDVYVWAVCKGGDSSGSVPVVIHLEANGAIQSVERAKNWSRDIPRLFPPDVREKFAHYQAGRAGELIEHIDWRRTHPEEPPLIILSSTSILISVTITPSPIPTQTIIPMITPDAIQVERWKEYEDALARTLLSFLPPEEVICEWEILGRSEQEVYVWAWCTSIISSGTSPISGTEIFSSSSIPAVIHLREDGSVQSVEIPGPGSFYARDISRMFPPDVQEKFTYYNFGGPAEIGERIVWRRTHPEEPPLIVLSATPIP